MWLNLFFLQSDSLLSLSEDLVKNSTDSISIMQLFSQGGIAGQVIILVLFIFRIE